MPTIGAVQAAATGMRPEKRVARSAPMRCMPMYQHTKPTTVTTAACHSSAAASVRSGARSQSPPSTTSPAAADSTAAIPQTVADSSLGPSGRRTGTASTAKPTSPASAHREKAIPPPSVRPHPWTVKAPTATSDAPHSTRRRGRRPSSNGTTTATTTGAHPTNTPGTAGSAERSAAITERLKPTIPTAASRVRRAHPGAPRPRSGAAPPRPTRGRSSRQARQ
ncbi:hypothetical protein BIV24_00980 [Streptomyces colonosanans]|uniref:Uncharacterized protein n=1 Tax=Streptomyces colonosanans TaxID=1428652 RepID=A0A1S2Q5G5_9ACTN|nr:hypothetical protein BIV24_00980 [Streptomyces colonosanans]